MPKVAIIIVNWNGQKETLACLKSLNNVSTAGCRLHVFLVDNASTASIANLKNFQFSGQKELTVVENKTNLGFSGGNNAGIKRALAAKADYLMLLNNDTFVDQKILEYFLAETEKEKDQAVLAPKIYFAPGREFHRQRYQKADQGRVVWYAGGIIDWQNVYASHRGVDAVDKGQFARTENTAFASGCCFFAPRQVFEKVGLFDDRFFLYYEDADWSLRVKQAGFRILFYPRAILWHKNAESTGKPGSALHQYYLTRNRLLFGYRYAGLRAKLALFRESLRLCFKNPTVRKAVFDFYSCRFGKATI